MKNPVQACKKPSQLLLLALEDLKKAEKSKRYQIDMDVWHSPNSHCSVCFAGAVMAFSLDCDSKMEYGPEHFNQKTRQRLHSLNSLRTGDICYFVEEFYDHIVPEKVWSKVKKEFGDDMGFTSLDIESYVDDPKVFKKQMKEIADRFIKIGL